MANTRIKQKVTSDKIREDSLVGQAEREGAPSYSVVRLKSAWKNLTKSVVVFWRAHWLGTAVILIATLIFFWPIVIRAGSYSEGGDAMFNSWAVARNQHCILRQDCPHYANGNVFFPHNDTMLYSESELSSGLVTLPLYFINPDPLFSNNVLTIMSFFLSGWFMYLLAKYLSRGKKFSEIYSILAGLIFEFAPIKMTEVWHLQNLSILYLPLAILLILKFFETAKKRYLSFLFIALVLQFYASWDQMFFVLLAVLSFIVGMTLFKASSVRKSIIVLSVIVAATLTTLPLAVQYVHFSKSSGATFTLNDQTSYESSLSDYTKPYAGTLFGRLYYKLRPHAEVNSFNPDSDSYHGLVLYAVAILVVFLALKRKFNSKKDTYNYAVVMALVLVALVGFVVSLGPLLKVRGSYYYPWLGGGIPVTIPLPYILVDKYLPQLDFVRAIGRASVITLFALCCTLALTPTITADLRVKYRYLLVAVVCFLVVIEILPDHRVVMSRNSYAYTLQVPKVYKYIKQNKSINDLIVLTADKDYPNAPFPIVIPEDMLWAGYTNRNIFNGYSSYQPPEYAQEYADFQDFNSGDIAKMKALGLRYVLVDRQLSTSNPKLAAEVSSAAGHPAVYRDYRYSLIPLY